MTNAALSDSETKALELFARYEEASRSFDDAHHTDSGALDQAIERIVAECPVESPLVAAKLLRWLDDHLQLGQDLGGYQPVLERVVTFLESEGGGETMVDGPSGSSRRDRV